MDIAVHKSTEPLWEITCHMGSHSVTCHKFTTITFSEITEQFLAHIHSGDFPAFTPAKAGTRYSDPGGIQG